MDALSLGYCTPTKPEFELRDHRLKLNGLFPLRPRRVTGHRGDASFPPTPLSHPNQDAPFPTWAVLKAGVAGVSPVAESWCLWREQIHGRVGGGLFCPALSGTPPMAAETHFHSNPESDIRQSDIQQPALHKETTKNNKPKAGQSETWPT